MGNVFRAMKKHEAEEPAEPQAPQAEPAKAKTAEAPPKLDMQQAMDRLRTGRPVQNGYSESLVAHHDRGGQITEEYRALRTNLLAQFRNERFCMLLTSAEAGEGKTVTCLNLAMILAERPDRRTIVVDCDLRRARVSSLLPIQKEPGLTELLKGTVMLKDATQGTAYPNLSIIAAGKARQEEVGELLGKAELEEVIAQLRRQYDFVLLDTPPINVASDAGSVGRAAGDAILVVRMNKTRRESVDKAIRLLHAANVRPVGIVLTHQMYYIPNYLYRYS